MNNTGVLKVTVAAKQATVDYIRTYLREDENQNKVNGDVAYSYTVLPSN